MQGALLYAPTSPLQPFRAIGVCPPFTRNPVPSPHPLLPYRGYQKARSSYFPYKGLASLHQKARSPTSPLFPYRSYRDLPSLHQKTRCPTYR